MRLYIEVSCLHGNRACADTNATREVAPAERNRAADSRAPVRYEQELECRLAHQRFVARLVCLEPTAIVVRGNLVEKAESCCREHARTGPIPEASRGTEAAAR